MPLHVWLPGAHANAPSHVSAIMSGVILKMGIYGLVRVLSLLPTPPLAWGYVVLGLGVVSGVLGVAFAVGQHDLKRLLAYHSIENIGIIVIGLGLALIGRTLHRSDWIVLGLGGALLHVWNHALFKSLLFFSAGSVVHATGTREIDRLGGLAKMMPRTSLGFLVGAIAICGLPPLNGFVSELFIYLGLFGTLGIGAGAACPVAAFAAPALSLIGALAVACFVKVFGAVFLGSARSEHARHAHESPWSMIGPMGVLMAGCGFIGLFPSLIAPVLGRAITAWSPETTDAGSRLATLAPLGWIGGMGLLLLLLLGLGCVVLRQRLGAGELATGITWSCGYAAPTARMQYTASSFAQMLVGLFGWALQSASPWAGGNAALSGEDPFSQPRPRHRAGPGGVAVVPSYGPALFLVPRLPPGKHPDLLALYLPDTRGPPALALMNTLVSKIIHVVLVLGLPPLLLGLIAKTKALFAGRRGAAAASALL